MSPSVVVSAVASEQSAQEKVARHLSLPEQEHLMLVKRLGQLQKQMTLLVSSYESQLCHWRRQLMRQSIRLMLERTRRDWGLLSATPAKRAPSDTPMLGTVAAAETEALICKTGCMMDNHHWRDGDQCLRTGMACQLTHGVTGPSNADTTAGRP